MIMDKNPYCVIKNGRIFTSRMFINGGAVVIKDGKILDVLDKDHLKLIPGKARIIDAKFNLVVPGFIDIHCHGGGGGDTSDGNIDSLKKISKAHARFGTTSMLVTIYPHTKKVIAERLKTVRKVMDENYDKGAKILGSHLEGPYLNPKRSGALKKKFFRKPAIGEFLQFIKDSGNTLKMITIAPELPGAIDIIKTCRKFHIRAAVGHSDANYEETINGINAGINHVTHIFNAMRRIHHRDPGVMGTVLINNEVTAELIADFHHVHPVVVTLLLISKHPDKLALITDSLRFAGLAGKKFKADGRTIYIKDGAAHLSDGTFAGSILTMNKAVRNIVDTGRVTIDDALKMASLNPAKIIGVADRKGSLLPERDADILILKDRTFDVLMTMVEGRIVFRSSAV